MGLLGVNCSEPDYAHVNTDEHEDEVAAGIPSNKDC